MNFFEEVGFVVVLCVVGFAFIVLLSKPAKKMEEKTGCSQGGWLCMAMIPFGIVFISIAKGCMG